MIRNHKTAAVSAVVLTLLALFVLPPRLALAADEVRTWRDSTGKFEVNATLFKQQTNAVQLKRDDGRVISVPIDRLSKEDREYLESLRKPNPFEVEEGLQAPASASLVMAIAEQLGGPQWSPGFVFHREGDKAFILVDTLEPRINANTRITRESTGEIAYSGTDAKVVVAVDPKMKTAPPRVPKETITIVWESPQGTKKVNAERLLTLTKFGKTILTGPAKDLPPPLPRSKAQVAQAMPVTVVGYEIDRRTEPPTFARTEQSTTLKSFSQDSAGNVAGLQIEAPEIGRLQNAIVLNAQGETIGCCTALGYARGTAKPFDVISAMPVQFLAKIHEPHVIHHAVAPRSGDAGKIEWEFVVYIADPFGKVSEPTLLVRRLHNIPDGTRATENSKIEVQAARDEKEVKLSKGTPSPEVVRHLVGHENAQYSATWVASVTLDNLGTEPSHNFHVQVRDRGGHDFPPSQIVFHSTPDPFGERAAPPDIPGLDGKPVDMPRPQPDPKGGWWLTSDITARRPLGPHQPIRLPKPQPSDRSVAAKKFAAGQYNIVELDMPAPSSEAGPRPTRYQVPMTFSPDGKWLYLVDETDVLRKIDTANLKETITLELGSPASDLSWSKAGLLLAFRSAHAHWVVNADTLTVVRERPMFEARLIAGSTAGTVGFALGTYWSQNEQGGTALAMIDFASGKLLHELRGTYSGHILQIEGRPVLNDQYFGIHMSADGKHLFLGGGALSRFRIEGTDLIFEESTAQLGGGHLSHLTLSNSGRRTAINDGPQTIAVFDAGDLSAQKVSLNIADHLRAVEFDDMTGNIFVAHSLNVEVFGPRGGKLTTLVLANGEVRRLITEPSGKRLVAWAGDTACIIDLNGAMAAPESQ